MGHANVSEEVKEQLSSGFNVMIVTAMCARFTPRKRPLKAKVESLGFCSQCEPVSASRQTCRFENDCDVIC